MFFATTIRRLPAVVMKITSRRSPVVASTATKALFLSTNQQQTSNFNEMEDMVERHLHRLHWKDAEDELKRIKHFMKESKTNHAIKTPTPEF